MTERRKSPEGTTPYPWMNQMLATPFWSLFASSASAAEPMARCAARCQLEMSSLVGARAKAWAGILEKVAGCRTPMDLFQAQVAFWQDAGRDYTDASEHLVAAWQAAIPGPFGAGGLGGVEPRDYITFPESKADEAAEERRRPGDSRRAA